MAQYERTKKITNSAYTPTVATSEANIRLQVDGSISEIPDMLFSTEEGKGASQVGVYNSGYTDLQTFVEAVESAGTGTLPPANTVTDNMLVDTAGQIKDRVSTNTTDIGTNLTNLDILRKAKLDTGVANAYVVNTEGTFSRVDGNILPFIPSNSNTGASTINEDDNGVANIIKYVDGAWIDSEEGDLPKNQQVFIAWNATESAFQLAPKGGNSVKSVQRGLAALGGLATLDITVSPVGTSSGTVAVPKITNRYSASLSVDKIMFSIELINSTTLRIKRNTTDASAQNLDWELIEFQNVKSYQKGTSTTTQTISSVVMNKTFIFDSVTTTSTGTSITDLDFRYILTTPTTLTFTGASKTHYWNVIEFN